jgi:hypothetical protein
MADFEPINNLLELTKLILIRNSNSPCQHSYCIFWNAVYFLHRNKYINFRQALQLIENRYAGLLVSDKST